MHASFSHEAVRIWFRRLKTAFPKPEKTRRKSVAVDALKLKLNGKQLFVWAAVDTKTKEVLACRISWQRNIIQAEAFLRKVLETCSNNPLILVDKGPWYPEALTSLSLKRRHMTLGMRNHIERWFSTLKARTKRLYNNSRKQLNHPKRQNLYRNIHNMVQHATQNKNLTTSQKV